jgi:translation initiation factor 1 (eIF-1/SUI1)
VKEDTLEIQGDHARRVGEKLTEIGFRVKGV